MLALFSRFGIQYSVLPTYRSLIWTFPPFYQSPGTSAKNRKTWSTANPPAVIKKFWPRLCRRHAKCLTTGTSWRHAFPWVFNKCMHEVHACMIITHKTICVYIYINPLRGGWGSPRFFSQWNYTSDPPRGQRPGLFFALLGILSSSVDVTSWRPGICAEREICINNRTYKNICRGSKQSAYARQA